LKTYAQENVSEPEKTLALNEQNETNEQVHALEILSLKNDTAVLGKETKTQELATKEPVTIAIPQELNDEVRSLSFF
jgi:hypothetical protein